MRRNTLKVSFHLLRQKASIRTSSGLLVFLSVFLLSCKQNQTGSKLFHLLSTQQTGVDFSNTVVEDETFNITTYEYLYNGGGVAAGDVNNDGLIDIYFTGNMVPNKLYLNKGNMQFEDISEQAGVAGRNKWKTGVNMADVNGDGWLDIYVCYSGPGTDAERSNQLFINKGVQNGIPVFEEKAAALGLDASGTYTTQCAFFDMDRDGDLDAFMVNHADMFYNVFYNTTQLRKLRHPRFGNRLYRNDGGHFVEVSDAAGISGSGINFGLGVAIGDVNDDHWPDIYVTNDYNEQDFLYLNNQDGTFSEVLKKSMGHISQFSMGVDMSDLNNDGWNDVVSLDMLPEDNYRQKLLKGPEGYDYYQLMVDSGYHHQNMRNMLQLNMGIAPDGFPRFSEIGQLAGISNTDWSWSPLVADFDNDGFKDLYVTNGYLRDFTNMDFLKYTFAEAQAAAKAKGDTAFAWQVIKDLQGTKLANYAFRNNGRLQFTNMAKDWGLDHPSISTGACYADLDNDGDVDLIINNTNEPASIYENKHSNEKQHHSLQIKLRDTTRNVQAIGATVRLFTANGMQQQTVFPARGFQSSSSLVLHFGLGKQQQVDSLQVWWPEGNTSVFYKLLADSLYELTPKQGQSFVPQPKENRSLFAEAPNNAGIDFGHQSDGFVDFKRLLGLPHQISRQGPIMAVADVNADNREDVFISGNDVNPARLYLQQNDASFKAAASQPWQQSRVPDGGVCLFDADADGDNDLYVARHGMQLNENDVAYQHQLYVNDGKGNFTNATNALPEMRVSSVSVSVADYNKDGKTDLLVACRSVPGRYPVVPTTYLLRNTSTTGNVKFEYAKEQQSQLLRQPGLVTCAIWADVNKDSWPDLLMAGEYMPITLFVNDHGQLRESGNNGFDKSNGWWCRLAADDLDNDGDIDLVSGNAGLNMQMHASLEKPVTMYYNDFDRNGIIDPVLTYYIQDKQVTALGLDDLAEETPVLKKKFLRYEQFAKATWNDLYDAESKKGTLEMHAYELSSCWWENDGKGNFTKHVLQLETQFSMVQAFAIADINKDGKKDIIAAGNYYPWRTQWGQMDASYGWVLLNQRKTFQAMHPSQSGLWLDGDVRDMHWLNGVNQQRIIVTRFNGKASVHSMELP
jgi:hypothetical protein